MDTYIGKLQPDSTVRYIKLLDCCTDRSWIASLLLNFYSRESRLDALLELGNLRTLNPTPYGVCDGYRDLVHCMAITRDEKGKKARNAADEADDKAEFLRMPGYNLLWEAGRWSLCHQGKVELLTPYTRIPDEKHDPFGGMDLYHSSADSYSNHLSVKDFKGWVELQPYADQKQTPVFVFRKERLIAAFKPTLKTA